MGEYTDIEEFSVEEFLENITENDILDFLFEIYGVLWNINISLSELKSHWPQTLEFLGNICQLKIG